MVREGPFSRRARPILAADPGRPPWPDRRRRLAPYPATSCRRSSSSSARRSRSRSTTSAGALPTNASLPSSAAEALDVAARARRAARASIGHCLRRRSASMPSQAAPSGLAATSAGRSPSEPKLDRSDARQRLEVGAAAADARPRPPASAGSTTSGTQAPAGVPASVRRLRTPRTSVARSSKARLRLGSRVAGGRPRGADQQRLAAVANRGAASREGLPDLLGHERHERVQQAQEQRARPSAAAARSRPGRRRSRRRGGGRPSPSRGTSRSSRSRRPRTRSPRSRARSRASSWRVARSVASARRERIQRTASDGSPAGWRSPVVRAAAEDEARGVPELVREVAPAGRASTRSGAGRRRARCRRRARRAAHRRRSRRSSRAGRRRCPSSCSSSAPYGSRTMPCR